MISRAGQCLPGGRPGALVAYFPAFGRGRMFSAIGTDYMFSSARGWLHIFPRLSSFRGYVKFFYYALSVFFYLGFFLLFQIQVGGRSIVCSDVQQNVVCIVI